MPRQQEFLKATDLSQKNEIILQICTREFLHVELSSCTAFSIPVDQPPIDIFYLDTKGDPKKVTLKKRDELDWFPGHDDDDRTEERAIGKPIFIPDDKEVLTRYFQDQKAEGVCMLDGLSFVAIKDDASPEKVIIVFPCNKDAIRFEPSTYVQNKQGRIKPSLQPTDDHSTEPTPTEAEKLGLSKSKTSIINLETKSWLNKELTECALFSIPLNQQAVDITFLDPDGQPQKITIKKRGELDWFPLHSSKYISETNAAALGKPIIIPNDNDTHTMYFHDHNEDSLHTENYKGSFVAVLDDDSPDNIIIAFSCAGEAVKIEPSKYVANKDGFIKVPGEPSTQQVAEPPTKKATLTKSVSDEVPLVKSQPQKTFEKPPRPKPIGDLYSLYNNAQDTSPTPTQKQFGKINEPEVKDDQLPKPNSILELDKKPIGARINLLTRTLSSDNLQSRQVGLKLIKQLSTPGKTFYGQVNGFELECLDKLITLVDIYKDIPNQLNKKLESIKIALNSLDKTTVEYRSALAEHEAIIYLKHSWET